MPHLETWNKLPPAIRQHLMERMRDRRIGVADLDKLRVWVESHPQVPLGEWYKDFGTFKIRGEGSYPKTFLLSGQLAKSESL